MCSFIQQTVTDHQLPTGHCTGQSTTFSLPLPVHEGLSEEEALGVPIRGSHVSTALGAGSHSITVIAESLSDTRAGQVG